MLKNALFIFNVVNVLALNNVKLLHGFDCEFAAWVLLQPPDFHVTERAYPPNTQVRNLISLEIPSPRDSPNTHSSGFMLLKISFFVCSMIKSKIN